ncbi:MAG TPA: YetF domain-containing protein [Anaerolineales bacterium]|nr:YetF domain-containing protein [Anaerolineales bacterium]
MLEELLGLGLDVADVSAAQMALRTVLIYASTLAIVRVGSKRFLSQATAFDAIVAIMLGSIMSRAINGSAPFLPTVMAGIILVGLHWLIAAIAYYSDTFGNLVKGHPVLLIEDGEIQQKAMRQSSLSSQDLAEALRLGSKVTDPQRVQLAYLERNGGISVIPRKPEPRVVNVSVQDGVETVRIELL